MRVKHYPRVSSKKQADKGDSVEFQDSRLKEDSKKEGDEVVAVITDAGKSASISDDKIEIRHKDGFVYAKIDIRKREGMNEILDTLTDDDWDALKITKWDRFSRNNIFSQLMLIYFRDNNKKIVAVDDSNDSLVRDILSVLGQSEIKKLVSRVRDVRKLRFKQGMFPARSPFGYKPIKRQDKIIGFKLHPKESKVVSDVFLMTEKGDSYKDICSKHKLKPQSYYNIIKNRIYCGYIEFEGVEKKGSHEAIVSEELWRKINDKGN